jgi:hypothetical protein
VVAEASKSLNLGNNDVYEDDGDGLWMGCSHGPVAGTLCEVSSRSGFVESEDPMVWHCHC